MASSSSEVCTDCAPSLDQQIKYNPMDPSTFVAPTPCAPHSIIIEFCDKCRWLHRATWTSTELFLTFPPPALKSITIVPLNSEDTAGRFRIWLAMKEDAPPVLVWDRKVEGQFPELKVLDRWALRRNSGFGIISNLIDRLVIQTNEIERCGVGVVLEL